MQEKSNKILIISVICLLATLGSVLGYRIGKDISQDEFSMEKEFEIVDTLPLIEENEESAETSSSMQTSSNILNEYTVIKQEEYTDCKHINSTDNVYLAESVEEALENIDDEYEVISTGTNGAIVSKKIEGCCSNHYLITIENNKVVIYKKISEKEKEKYRDLDVSINILREDLLEDLKKGIEVDKIEDLNKIIEEIES